MGGHNLYNVRSSIGTGSLLSDPGPGDPVLYCSRAVEVRGKAASYPGPRSSGGARGQNDIFRCYLR